MKSRTNQVIKKVASIMINSECAEILGAERCEVPEIGNIENVSVGIALLAIVVLAAVVLNGNASFGATLLENTPLIF